jgi:uncharacterized damage-inducible protein DinB
MGKHWSFPTLKGMFAHLYGADAIWLSRWKGLPSGRMQGDADFSTVGELRAKWDLLEAEQRAFVDGLSERDLPRLVTVTQQPGRGVGGCPRTLLQHVVNHATHHRSEVATMLTMASGSPRIPASRRIARPSSRASRWA